MLFQWNYCAEVIWAPPVAEAEHVKNTAASSTGFIISSLEHVTAPLSSSPLVPQRGPAPQLQSVSLTTHHFTPTS